MKFSSLALLAVVFAANDVNAFVVPSLKARNAIVMSAEPATAEAKVETDMEVNGNADGVEDIAIEPEPTKAVKKAPAEKKAPWPRSMGVGSSNVWNNSVVKERNGYFVMINCLFSDELKELYDNFTMNPRASDVQAKKANKELYWEGVQLFNKVARNKNIDEDLYNSLTTLQYEFPGDEKFKLENGVKKINSSEQFRKMLNKIHTDLIETARLSKAKDVEGLISDIEAGKVDLGKNTKPIYFIKFLEQNPDVFNKIINKRNPDLKNNAKKNESKAADKKLRPKTGAFNVWKNSVVQEQNEYLVVINCLFSDELKDLYTKYTMNPGASDIQAKKQNKELYYNGLQLFNRVVKNKDIDEELYNSLTSLQYKFPGDEKFQLDGGVKGELFNSNQFQTKLNKIHKDLKQTIDLWKKDGKNSEVDDVLNGLIQDIDAGAFDRNSKALYFIKFLEKNPDIFEMITGETVKKQSTPKKDEGQQMKSPSDVDAPVGESDEAFFIKDVREDDVESVEASLGATDVVEIEESVDANVDEIVGESQGESVGSVDAKVDETVGESQGEPAGTVDTKVDETVGESVEASVGGDGI